MYLHEIDTITKNIGFVATPQKDLQDKRIETTKQAIIVQGDYIAGDKHVGAHIDHVASNAIGAQINKN